MKNILLALLLLIPTTALAATRDYSINFTQECMTVEGDSLDQDGDGICEDLDGFRVYDDEGNFVTGIPEDGTRTMNFRMNRPWGVQCVTLTAHMTDPIDGSFSESAMSATGGCIEVRPGRPNAPVLRN